MDDVVVAVIPYYSAGGIVIYHGDTSAILPSLQADFVLTDPPYGIDVAVDNMRFSGGTKTGPRTHTGQRIKVHGDTVPFDPTPLLRFPRLVLFGANNYAAKLPPSNGWIIWDKRAGLEEMEGWPFGDGEMAWTNVTGAVRFWRNRWMGLVRSDEKGQHYHPTQKPVALMAWILAKWRKPADVVLDPFMGSGSTLVAAKNASIPAIGIEIEERYCEIAAERLSQEVFAL